MLFRSTIFNMRHYIESNNINCELLSNEYIGAKNHLIFKCTCGNEFATTWNEFKVGKQQCNSCGRLVTSKLFKLDESEVAEYFANYDCKLLSSYKGSHELLDVKCSCGNVFSTSFSGFKSRKHKCCDVCCNMENGYLNRLKQKNYNETLLFQKKNLKKSPIKFHPKKNHGFIDSP